MVHMAEAEALRYMAWTVPQYTRGQVNGAGDVLLMERKTWDDFQHYLNALEIINNRRSSHSFPLLSIRMLLQRQAKRVDDSALIAQRTKRLSSIELKLRRFRTMKLSQMQDIGGCRAIVASVDHTKELSQNIQKSRTRNGLDHVDDYISIPQRSGYRGIHHIYRFSTETIKECNGLKIEIQLRSPMQHAWATAVETVGTFTRQALKSSQGSEEWLRFFQLMGTVVALREATTPVADTPTERSELVTELRHHAERLAVVNRLTAFGNALNISETDSTINARYFLLQLDPSAENVTIAGFRKDDLVHATRLYADVEKQIAERGGDAVLVSVDSLALLRRAYPNYFLDTRAFIGILEEELSSQPSYFPAQK
jgi:ppGpp synthetase/RelA/SpoT-type nucleotidyltranferase